MVDLRWTGNDGYDSSGRRVAWIVPCFEAVPFGAVVGGDGPAVVAPRRYWDAYVARDGRFDRVEVDGSPGQWRRKAEAQLAAEEAYSTETGGEDALEPGADPAPIGRDLQVRMGPLGHVLSLVRARRHARRDRVTGDHVISNE